MFGKLGYVIKEVMHLAKKEKAFFMLPILLMIALLVFIAYQVGPSIIVAFIYAGV